MITNPTIPIPNKMGYSALPRNLHQGAARMILPTEIIQGVILFICTFWSTSTIPSELNAQKSLMYSSISVRASLFSNITLGIFSLSFESKEFAFRHDTKVV